MIELKIEVKKALRLLGSQQKASLVCPYCGSEVQSYTEGVAICNLCEMPVGTDSTAPLDNPQLKEILVARASAIFSGQWETALEISSQLEGHSELPILYGNAIFYACYSEYLYNKTNYTLGGFMEENATNKELSNAMYMKSKDFLFKALNRLNAKAGQLAGDELYMNALISIKLGKRAVAAREIDELSKLNYAQIAIDYLKLLLSMSSNNIRESEILINKLINAGETNSIYLASKLLSGNDPKSAKLLYGTLTKKILAFSLRPKPF
ncbi:MAG: hypothetical protein QXW90_02020 [Candidatus Micrarchaeaceae archaeon]